MAERKKSKGSRRNRGEWRSLLAKFDRSGLGGDAVVTTRHRHSSIWERSIRRCHRGRRSISSSRVPVTA